MSKIISKQESISFKNSKNELKFNKIIIKTRRQIIGIGLVFHLKFFEFQQSNPTLAAAVEKPSKFINIS